MKKRSFFERFFCNFSTIIMSFGGGINYAVFNKANGIKFLYFYSRFALAVSCKILVLRAEVAYLLDTLHVQLP